MPACTRRFFVLFFLLCTFPVWPQLSNSGNLKTYIDNIISNMPQTNGSNDYQDPSNTQLEIWERVVTDIINAEYVSAHNRADSIGYNVIHYTDTSPDPDKDYYILQKQDAGSNYWGTYIFNQAPDRLRLIIQSPHPRADFNTGRQGFFIFRNLGARVFCLSGTHRCNSSSFSDCDGTTKVCSPENNSENFRVSDQAHNADGIFQRTTSTLAALITDIIVVQPHGFSKDDGEPDLIMSNGSTQLPPTDFLSILKTELLAIDADLIFKIAHIDFDWDELLALTNTQGRFINGSVDPCDDNAPANTGRFLHIEQARDSLRDNETNLLKLSDALANTFPIEPLPVELISFTAIGFDNSVKLKWQTATEVNNYGFEVQRSKDGNQKSEDRNQDENYEWEKIGFIKGNGNSNSVKEYSFVDQNISSGHYSYRLKQIDNDGTYEYSKIAGALIISPDEYILEQNYPNPFNPATNFKFRIPSSLTGDQSGVLVTLKIYDVLGRDIAEVVNEELHPGEYEFPYSSPLDPASPTTCATGSRPAAAVVSI
ncbi:MAG: hypothetical protein R6W90_16080, partial [Ignavibacteriaceae bacterium]